MPDNFLLFNFFEELREQQPATLALEEYYLLYELIEQPALRPKGFSEFAAALETMWLKTEVLRPWFQQRIQQYRDSLMTLLEDWIKYNSDEDQPLTAVSNTAEGTPRIEYEKLSEHKQEENKENTQQLVGEERQKGIEQNEFTTPEEEHTIPSQFGVKNGDTNTTTGLTLHQDQLLNSDVPTPFPILSDYFPVKSRELQQVWRTLKSNNEGQEGAAIDIIATSNLIAKQGYFSGFRYIRNRINQLQLFVFVDESETMAAVESFGEEICAAARASGIYPELRSIYFNTVPLHDTKKDDYWFNDASGIPSISLNHLFSPYLRKNIVVMIYSDGGCLKNGMTKAVATKMKAFVKHLRKKVAYVSWVNPSPLPRWSNCDLDNITGNIPMYESTRNGFERAVATLKGKYMINNNQYVTG
ncbi:hypothetical protein [Chitinophaga sp.]|uniref:hypothetical protein n=1 Tax=Chitinophaga sp. TaxID=1869181 RepID=UPI0031DBDE13